ncbi:MAG TPA: hypothetical protein VFV38_22155 [Ktedonobacteraceae bacterium]|nr:hypothetical protein [Ktedonobacteraceae bacterium]
MPDPLNLDNQPDVETFRNRVMASTRIPQEQKEDIIANVLLLNSYFHLQPGMSVFTIRAIPPKQHAYFDFHPIYNEYYVEIGNAGYVFDLYKAWQFGLQISTFASCPGFEELIQAIQRNPQKIEDYIFEAEMAFLCKHTFAGGDFKFNQPYMIKGRLKYPDFEFTSSLGRLIVECKRLHYREMQLNRRYEELQEELQEKISQLGLDETHRVEVKLAGAIPSIKSFVTNFEKQVALHDLAEEVSYQEGENEIWIAKQNTPLHFNGSFLSRHSMATVNADMPTPMGTDVAYCVLVVPEEAYIKLVTKLGDLINEASGQIPPSYMGLIFIDTPHTQALEQAWKRKDLKRHYTNILALGIYHKQNVVLHHRTTDEGKIRQLIQKKAMEADNSSQEDC